MEIFGRNIRIKNIDHVEPKVDLLDMVHCLYNNLMSSNGNNPYLQDISESLNEEDSLIKIYYDGIAVTLNLGNELTDKHINNCCQITFEYFYKYNDDSFHVGVYPSNEIEFANVGLWGECGVI